jgi:hypothetical protein
LRRYDKEPDAHDERKRKYNVNHEVEVSEEEMEAGAYTPPLLSSI